MIDTILHQQIDRWLAEHADWQAHLINTTRWFETKRTSLYLRLGSTRMIDGTRVRTLDVANVTVNRPYQNQGIFTAVLTFLESKEMPLFIENVLPPRFRRYFDRRDGYRKTDITGLGDVPCYVFVPVVDQAALFAVTSPTL